ncbi:MAG TPA: bifunctional demethylmenaquinone methyltransferase/2-methoxy-6-polyprenyl-1,4-benzoquinol methylase UbiE [Alphaproteobacteria bacterium]|jgi:demethylmenaquinone methyltransferase/2-methoxy-6-polyprenyl-1,4-benzoquinol methylase|nr:bifunctional demethylmenaquinone methyltransferase/2-methoxy-6-polyprenyl-1,4-benzoquinol methylase UbiE [Alphaproteobacteria bacterium]
MTDAHTNSSAPESGWFGDRPVDPREKTGLVREVFDRVASRYDLMNDLMSGGVHRLWKADFIRAVAPRSHETLLDVAAGTGDIAAAWRRHGGGPAVLCDINEAMLSNGRDRAFDRGRVAGLSWAVGNAEALPFPDRSFDAYTIAFGLRNVTDIDAALSEARRVLKPGGRFFCLEFSRVAVPPLRRAYDAYSDAVIPRLGAMVAKDRDSYVYLVESIRRFPPQEALIERIERAGLSFARYRNLSAGIAAIHRAVRI